MQGAVHAGIHAARALSPAMNLTGAKRYLGAARSRIVDVLGALQGSVALLFLVFLPGFAWVDLLLPGRTIVERLVLSVALSVMLVLLSVFLANILLGVEVSVAHAIAFSIAIILAALGARVAPHLERAIP